MSVWSRFFLGVILTGLAFIASLRLYRVYEKYALQQAQDPAPTLTFHAVPVSLAPAVPQAPRVQTAPARPPQEIYLQDVAPDEPTAREQARQTIHSILADYQDDPTMQAFEADLRAASNGEASLAVLSGEGLSTLLDKYPQLQDVIDRYARDKAFAPTLQEIFGNPQFAASVAVLQGSAQ